MTVRGRGPGLAWGMEKDFGGGSVVLRRLVVVSRTVLVRSGIGVWRSGVYASEPLADGWAVTQAAAWEADGYVLVEGPAVVDLSAWDGATGRSAWLDGLTATGRLAAERIERHIDFASKDQI